jgi:LacI family transcriptional regulator
MESSRKRVALFVETSLGSGRSVLRGIAKYAHQVDDWQLFHAARGLEEALPDWVNRWEGDGIIARIQTPEMAKQLSGLRIPVVDVLGVVENGFPLVHVDNAAIAREVAEYFAARNFRNLAYYGIAGENWSEARRDAFQKHADTATLQIFERPRGPGDGSLFAGEELRAWVRDLPKPVGIMVCSDQRGLSLLEACAAENIAVPEQVAVLGVDNDEPLCEACYPPLSSVRAGHREVGFKAAGLLDDLMEGAVPIGSPVLALPQGIVTRRSSETMAITDPAVAQGVRYLNQNLSESMTNEAIARVAGLSRTLFQQRFRAAMGMSIRAYLVQQRLHRAKSLIENSDLTLVDIAQRAGFKHQEYMGSVFKRELGITPASLRNLG